MLFDAIWGRRTSVWSRFKARLLQRYREPIRLGFLAGLSGPTADLGEGIYRGALLAVQAVNADGGIDGRPVELVVRDDHNDPATARNHFLEFADAGIELVLGPATSSIALALAPLADERRVALFSPTVMTAELSGRDDHFFRLTPPLLALARQQVRHLLERGLRRLALATGDGNPSYVADYTRTFTGAWLQAGGTVPIVAPFGGGSGTDAKAAARALAGAGVDAVVVVAAGPDVAQLATALRGLDPQPLIVSAHWADTGSLLLAEGADIEGLIVSQYFDPHCREPRYLEFVQRYRRQYAAEPGFAGIFGFDTTDYALAALARREKGQSIKEAILGVPPQRGLQGLRHMDTMGDGLSTVGLARVQNHELVALDDPSPAVSGGPPMHRQLLPPLAVVAVLPMLVLWLLMTLTPASTSIRGMAGLLAHGPALVAAVAVALAMAAIVSHALARAERLRQRALVRAAHDSVDCTLGAAASFGTAEHDALWSELQGLLTRLRSSEAAAQDSRRQLQQLFEATSEVAIVACDLQGRVTVFNRGAEKLLQQAAADVVWRGHVLDWVHADDLATLAQQASAGDGPAPQGLEILARHAREQGHHLRDLRWVRADGTVIEVAQAMTVMRDALGVPSGYLAVATDLTAHHRAERALAASRAKTDLLSRVSHELRTPLNAVLGFAQLLQGGTLGALNQQQHARVAHIQAAGWHLLGIIDDLLDLARAEAGALHVRSEPVALLPLVEQAGALVESAAQTAAVRLLPAECPAANLHALADPDRLRQVVVNLLSNAIKYNRPGGTVTLSVAPGEAGCVVIGVQDDGLGMTPEQQAQLFEPFNRLGRERGPAPGTGIGLTIVKQLTEAMGGTLSVCSEPGRGSRFAITLPAAEPASASLPLTTDAAPPQQPCDTEGDVVLIEDNEVNALIVQAALAARPRCRLHVCGDGASGLRQVRACRPALVLLDMNLPDIDGAVWIAQLRADPALDGVTVVGLSGDATPQTVQRARAAGAADYLFKPISVKDLLDVVDHALCADHQHR